MTDYGIKVMKVGYPITDNDVRNILMSSKNNLFKYHTDNTTSLSINNGENSGEVNIAHNLGFVPAFISYIKTTELTSRDYILPFPGGIYLGIGFNIVVDSYATSSNITLRVNNTTDFGTYQDEVSDLYDAHWSQPGFILNGRKDGNARHGAFRFTGLDIPQGTTLSSADISCCAQWVGPLTTSLKYKIWGIDEDNTATFGNPMGRDKTTAVDARQTSMNIPAGSFFGVEVKDQLQEIINRAGWSSGNAAGFIIEDDGTDEGCWWEDDIGTGSDSYLRVVQPGSVSFYFRVIIFKDRIDF